MARDDLPKRDPEPERDGRFRFIINRLFGEFGPVALGIEHGAMGVIIGVGIWLIFGLIWLAFIVGGVTFYGMQRRGRR